MEIWLKGSKKVRIPVLPPGYKVTSAENDQTVDVTGTPINFRCRIIEFDYGEEDGTGDISYTLTFKEYRPPSAGGSSVTTM